MSAYAVTYPGKFCFDDELPTQEVPMRFDEEGPPERVDPAAALELEAEFLDARDEDVWASKLLNQGETLASAGRLFEAVEMMGLVLTLEPRNDVARARLHDLSARLVSRRQARGDETVQVSY